MSKAVHAVVVDRLSIRQELLHFNIPKSTLTLSDCISGRIEPGIDSGPPKYSSHEEESELEQFPMRCSNVGIPKDKEGSAVSR